MSHITIYITSIFTTFTPNRTGVGSKPVDDDVWTLDHLSIKCQNHCDCQQKGYFGHDSCGPSNKKWGISSLVLFLSPRVSLSLHNVYIDICVIYIYTGTPRIWNNIWNHSTIQFRSLRQAPARINITASCLARDKLLMFFFIQSSAMIGYLP